MHNLDNNAHSVFLLHYHLIMVVKYRRKVIDDHILQEQDIFLSTFVHLTELYSKSGTMMQTMFM